MKQRFSLILLVLFLLATIPGCKSPQKTELTLEQISSEFREMSPDTFREAFPNAVEAGDLRYLEDSPTAKYTIELNEGIYRLHAASCSLLGLEGLLTVTFTRDNEAAKRVYPSAKSNQLVKVTFTAVDATLAQFAELFEPINAFLEKNFPDFEPVAVPPEVSEDAELVYGQKGEEYSAVFDPVGTPPTEVYLCYFDKENAFASDCVINGKILPCENAPIQSITRLSFSLIAGEL